MDKKIFLFKDRFNDRQAFITAVLSSVIPALRSHRPDSLKLTLTRTAPPKLSVIPFSRCAIACISVTGPQPDLVELESMPHFWGAYTVAEALPVSYVVDWPAESWTTGVCLLTLFNRKPKLTDAEFLERWHNGHTPLSLKIHPLWNYVRNVVTHTDAGVSFEGIVEEQVRCRADLLNPVRFFGGPLMMGVNMVRTFVDTKSFIDYRTMETFLAEELWIVRQPAEGTGDRHGQGTPARLRIS